MLIGNKAKIAFDFIEVSNGLAKVTIYLDSHNLTFDDNGHYYPMIINGLEKEIQILENTNLSLMDEFQNLTLNELYDLAQNQDMQIHQNVKTNSDYFCYDLSTHRAYIFAYEDNESLMFFGKFIGNDKLITCQIAKSEYLKMLDDLMNLLIKANPNHPIHNF